MSKDVRKHQVSLCGDVQSWADALFAQHPEWPFGAAHIEEYGRGNNKRQDLQVLDREHRTPILTGEVEMPGTPEGRSPYDPALMQNAFNKADNIQAKYFFTWNVNRFVLFDRSRWDRLMIDRMLKDWDLGLGLTSSGDCARPEVQAYIRDKFLPQFFAEFAKIVQGTLVDWAFPPADVFLRSLESHLDWPLIGTRDYLAMQCAQDKAFAARLLAEVLASCRAVWIAQDSLAVGREQQFANPKNQVSSQVLDGSCPPEPIQFDFTMVKDRIRP